VLDSRILLARDGLTVADVACRHGAGRGADGEHTAGWALVLVRRGCFARSADGAATLLDPTMAYALRPGEQERYDHPHGDGDDCTAIFVDDALLATLRGGEPGLPPGGLRVGPETDLRHRLLLSSLRRGEDDHDGAERALALCAALLHGTGDGDGDGARRLASGRPATRAARRALVDGAREALAADPEVPLPRLARELGTSPHHLSRIFGAATGHSIARHRMRLRARHALERLAAGDAELARLAAATGFADQSHLTRVLRAETGATPASLRARLAPRAAARPARAPRR
jgi:AraC-like DNA-binding protein